MGKPYKVMTTNYKKFSYMIKTDLDEYVQNESATIVFTHFNVGSEGIDIYWLKTYGLGSYCIETKLSIDELIKILRKEGYDIEDPKGELLDENGNPRNKENKNAL